LIDEGETGDPVFVAGKSLSDFLEKAAIDFINDLEMSREESAE
jgi:hypothetical protein